MKKQILLCCLTALTFFGCKKGDTGAPGTNGTNGNANVESFNYPNQLWYNDPFGADMTISVPAITQSVLDKGVIIVYARMPGDIWFSIPDKGIHAAYNVNWLEMRVDTMVPANSYLDIKVVVIPSS